MKLTKYCTKNKYNEDSYILLHTLNGNIIIINNMTYQKIINKKYEMLPRKTLMLLKESGFLVNFKDIILERYNQTSIYKKIKSFYKKESALDLMFIPTYNCNFKCPYCSQNNIKKNISSDEEVQVNPKKNIYSIFEYIKNQYSGRSINIHLYGGEPLLNKNKNYIKTLSNYVKDNKTDLKINNLIVTTNGYNIDKFIDDLEYFDQFQITLDGPPEIHNNTRKHINNSPTFHRILDNILLLLEKNKKIFLRINFNIDNLYYMEEMFNILKYKKIIPSKNITFSFSPIFSSDFLQLDKNDLQKSFEYIKKSKTLINYFDNYLIRDIFTKIEWSLNKNYPYIYNPFSCNAFEDFLIFGPEQNVYGCNYLISDNKYKIGSYKRKPSINKFKRSILKLIRLRYDLKCINCKYFMFCGKSCFVSKMKLSNYKKCPMRTIIDNYIEISVMKIKIELKC
ncbi:MAG: radical SAM protein [Halanaerobiales bacterium]|nr:radical SAM protein [Halanaerobiales bacterium]